MKTKTLKSTLLILSLSLLVFSCKKDDDDVSKPKKDHDEEVITTITLIFTDSAGIQTIAPVTFRDPDGEGGLAPDIHDTIRLSANSTYYAQILLLNETESPADTISNEVLEEGDEHLFCFVTNGVDLNIDRTDSDGIYEIGLSSTWRSGSSGNGSVNVTLKHQPDVKDGSCDPGETDIDVTFVTEIQ